MLKALKIQWIITVAAILLAVGHILHPDLKIDAVTVTLLAIAVVPWLAPLFKKLKLPGGVEVEFQDLQRAKEQADKAGLLATPAQAASTQDYSFQVIAADDPILALAGFRIELEKRLLKIAENHGVVLQRGGIGLLIRELTKKQILTNEQQGVLADMVGLLNSAVHGAEVPNQTAAWALDVAPRLLKSLDDLA